MGRRHLDTQRGPEKQREPGKTQSNPERDKTNRDMRRNIESVMRASRAASCFHS